MFAMQRTQHLRLCNFFAAEEGATAIEYALIVAMIAVGIIASLKMVGSSLQSDLNTVVTGFQSASK